MKKKLRSSKGMTLTELIMALAVVSLIGVSLTTGINGGVKVYRDATRLYEAETLCGTILTYLEDEFRFARNIQIDLTDPGEPDPLNPAHIKDEHNKKVASFDSQYFGSGARIDAADGKILIKVPAPPDPAVPAGSALEYKLLSDSAYTSGLKVSKCEIRYKSSTGQVKITVAVKSDVTNANIEHTVRVAPLGG